MTKTYEQKLAERKARADAKKATTKWHKLGIGIDRILEGMGYRPANYYSIYQYKTTYWMGMEQFEVIIDTKSLIHDSLNGKLNVTVTKIAR